MSTSVCVLGWNFRIFVPADYLVYVNFYIFILNSWDLLNITDWHFIIITPILIKNIFLTCLLSTFSTDVKESWDKITCILNSVISGNVRKPNIRVHWRKRVGLLHESRTPDPQIYPLFHLTVKTANTISQFPIQSVTIKAFWNMNMQLAKLGELDEFCP